MFGRRSTSGKRVGLVLRARALFPVLFLGTCVLDFQASAQDGLNLLHKMQTALGGAKNIAAIGDFEEIQSAATFSRDGKPLGKVVKRIRWIGPNVLRLDQVGPGDTYVLYFDGATGWEVLSAKNEKKVISLAQQEVRGQRRVGIRGVRL